MTDNITNLFQKTLVFDTETTSLDFKVAEVIEWASAPLMEIVETVSSEEYKIRCNKLYKPSEPLPPEISAVTTITNRMIDAEADCKFDEDLATIQTELNHHDYCVAHNIFYDANILARYSLKMPRQICTMRLAKKLYADDINIKEYNLSYLRYALDLPVSDELVAHRADADIIVTGMLFVTLLEKAIADGEIDAEADDLGFEIVKYLEKPVKIKVMPFGKHKGKKLVDVPISYWQWAIENFDALQEDRPEYDKDFAESVAEAVQEIFDNTN